MASTSPLKAIVERLKEQAVKRNPNAVKQPKKPPKEKRCTAKKGTLLN
jgi:hypothetical protein